jgi:hypothetical protein
MGTVGGIAGPLVALAGSGMIGGLGSAAPGSADAAASPLTTEHLESS